MDSRKKVYYLWESWNKAFHDRGMQPLDVKYCRLIPYAVRGAQVQAPYVEHTFSEGSEHRLIHWKDVYLRSDGRAFDIKGNRMGQFDIKLSDYGKPEE